MLNEHYKKAAQAVKTMNKSGNSMFGALLAFAHSHKGDGFEALKAQFKAQEKLASDEMKVEMGKNSTYKVAKGKLIKAVELGIPLVDADGKALGKTDLEGKIKEIEDALAGPATPKAEPTPFDLFQAAMKAASEASDKVDAKDAPIMAGMALTLLKKLEARIVQPLAA